MLRSARSIYKCPSFDISLVMPHILVPFQVRPRRIYVEPGFNYEARSYTICQLLLFDNEVQENYICYNHYYMKFLNISTCSHFEQCVSRVVRKRT
jgi:hypothetical protein